MIKARRLGRDRADIGFRRDADRGQRNKRRTEQRSKAVVAEPSHPQMINDHRNGGDPTGPCQSRSAVHVAEWHTCHSPASANLVSAIRRFRNYIVRMDNARQHTGSFVAAIPRQHPAFRS
jgi:hypothetical protein